MYHGSVFDSFCCMLPAETLNFGTFDRVAHYYIYFFILIYAYVYAFIEKSNYKIY